MHRWRELTTGFLAVLCLSMATLAWAEEKAVPDVTGDWRGSYVCPQGKTGLTVSITTQKKDEFTGYFHFYPLADNSAAKAGCFTLRGRVDGQGLVTMEAGRWMSRPEGYVTVDLNGRVDVAGHSMSGEVVAPAGLGAACQTFELAERSLPATIDSLCQKGIVSSLTLPAIPRSLSAHADSTEPMSVPDVR